MPTTKRGDSTLYWERHGHGPALVLGAGLGGVGSYWNPNLAELASHFTVYLFDQRGTGKSSRQPVQSIEQMSDDLIAVMDHAELVQTMYLGHSTGGAIGVATVLDHPGRITAMTIYASTTHGDAYRRRILQLRSRLFSGLGIKDYAEYSSYCCTRHTGSIRMTRIWRRPKLKSLIKSTIQKSKPADSKLF